MHHRHLKKAAYAHKNIFLTNIVCIFADFSSLVQLLSRVRPHSSPGTHRETVLRDREAEQSWQIFKDAFHRAQELPVSRCKNSGKEGKRPAWLCQDLLVKLKGKKMHRQWKQGQVFWEDHRDTAQLCGDGVRKAKAQLELNLARDAKNNNEGFYRHISQKKVKESVPPS